MYRAPHRAVARRRRVLLIDDSDDARILMRRILTDAGFEVFDQGTPIGATSAILRNNVSIVVIDVNMPAINGDKLATMFRANPRLHDIGLILVSGIPEDELERLAENAQADGTVSKARIAEKLAFEVGRVGRLRSVHPPEPA